MDINDGFDGNRRDWLNTTGQVFKSIEYDPKDLDELLGEKLVRKRVRWLHELRRAGNRPITIEDINIRPCTSPEVYGVFTVTHDDYVPPSDSDNELRGAMLVEVAGKGKWLLIEYSLFF